MFLKVTYSLLAIVLALSFALFARSVEEGSAALLTVTPAVKQLPIIKQRIVRRDIMTLECTSKRCRLEVSHTLYSQDYLKLAVSAVRAKV